MPYGSWASPISAALVAETSPGFSAVQVESGRVYWIESRPAEQGRSVVVAHTPTGDGRTLTPDGFDARSRVHEYGGGSYLVKDGVIYFTNFADQALYRQAGAGSPVRITESDGLRFADFATSEHRDWLVCVREDHRRGKTPVNALVRVDLAAPPSDGEVIFDGSDFVAYPTVNARGDRLAWIAWDFPNMPWDNVAVWVADIDTDGRPGHIRRVNEGVAESVLQPRWAPDGSLYLISDRSGWWNVHRCRDGSVEPVLTMRASFGGPLWVLGASFYALVSAREAVVCFGSGRGQQLAMLDLVSGELRPFDLPFNGYASIEAESRRAWFTASRPDAPPALIELDVDTGTHRTLATAGERPFPEAFVSRPESLEFPTDEGRSAYAYYYPPRHPTAVGPVDELPPLIVEVHGGPTSAASPAYSLQKHFWTSRGFAILDVNYTGSTGYGREFRRRLYGQWGAVDLRDVIHAARYAVERGLADPRRLIIHGGSAGGFLVLAALAFDDTFSAGGNYFGVSDLEALATDTHKFESRYLDQLVGPYPASRKLYVERSPIHHLDGFDRPLITFQGLDDRIVPPDQSMRIFESLRDRGVPVAMLTFDGEGHGLRKAETRARALEAELYFYGRVLGFEPAGPPEPVRIANLD